MFRKMKDDNRFNENQQHNLGPLLPIIFQKIEGSDKYIDLNVVSNKGKRFMIDFLTDYQESGCEELSIASEGMDTLKDLLKSWTTCAAAWKFDTGGQQGQGMGLAGFTFLEEWDPKAGQMMCVVKMEQTLKLEVRIAKSFTQNKNNVQ